MDDWAEVVRKAIEDDPEQPDRALLSRMLDEAMALNDGQSVAARHRHEAAEIRAATSELVAVTEVGKRLRDAVERVGPIARRVAADVKEKAERLRDLEARRAPSNEIADLRQEMADAMASMRAVVLTAHKERWSAEPLSTHLPAYLAAKTIALKDSKHLSAAKPKIELFIRTVGDKPVRDYERADFETFRNLLDQTPKGWKARFKTENLATAVAANAKLSRPLAPMEPKTVDDGYLTHVKNCFGWLDTARKIERNPGVGVVSARTDPQQRPDEGRFPFTPPALSAYLAYAAKKRSRATPDYWMPLLALYTGARLNELCQIEPGRIVEREGAWLIDLLTIYDRQELERLPETERLKLKSASARREIPVHDDLVAAGFLDFVQSRRGRRGRLFPTLKADQFGYYSSAISKRLNLDIARAEAKAGRVSFYSLRHNFRAALTNASVPDRTADRVMGHVIQGAQAHYGSPHLEAAEILAVRRIAFPGVDITPYLSRGR
uniref:Site-specific integrase n=1 Tax=Bosea sp. NBC_00436 TaxID=2969620 RepID=A0A9E7ZMY9_9HYPH